MSKDSDWRDGRLVLRRSEARNSAIARCELDITAAESAELSATLKAAVAHRRDLTPKQRQDGLDALAALVAREAGRE